MHGRQSNQSAFTLIELSIVLVIIGLLAAGILVGQDLIEAAKIRRQVSQISEISAALNTFKGKYGELPGDMTAHAGDFGLTEIGFIPGQDNGVINDQFGNTVIRTPDYEPEYFFAHLAEAQLIPITFLNGSGCSLFSPFEPFEGNGRYYAMTLNPQMGMIAVTYQDKTWAYLGISDCASRGANGVDILGVMTPSQAYSIDNKLDNGVPSGGSVLAYRSSASSGMNLLDTIDVTPGECISTLPASSYNVTNTTNQCRLLVRLQ